jgi:CheY-like chemotaxis protein
VDDNPANLKILSRMLESIGYEVRFASDGLRALDCLRCERPDLILMDIHMPGLDGYETCRRLKADPLRRDIPVIFCTALNDDFNKSLAYSVGGIDYITKPYFLVEFETRLKVHLAHSRQQRCLELLGHALEHQLGGVFLATGRRFSHDAVLQSGEPLLSHLLPAAEYLQRLPGLLQDRTHEVPGRRINLLSSLRGTQSFFTAELRQRGVTLHLHFDRSLPDVSGDEALFLFGVIHNSLLGLVELDAAGRPLNLEPYSLGLHHGVKLQIPGGRVPAEVLDLICEGASGKLAVAGLALARELQLRMGGIFEFNENPDALELLILLPGVA